MMANPILTTMTEVLGGGGGSMIASSSSMNGSIHTCVDKLAYNLKLWIRPQNNK